jgi:hypothetical protein
VLARTSAAGLSLVLSLVLATAGCGQSKLDTSRLESQIKKTLSDRTGFQIRSVACPDDVDAKKGDTFRCTVTTDRNEQVGVNVTQDDGQGGVTWKLAGPLKR